MEKEKFTQKGNGTPTGARRTPRAEGADRRSRGMAPAGPYRQEPETDENLVAGRNAVKELLSSGRDVDKLLVAKGDREGSIGMLVSIALDRGIPVVEADRRKLDALTGNARHQGVVAYAAGHAYVTVEQILQIARDKGEKPLIALCDGVEDPHNLGAIIRSAECAGFHGLIIPKRRAVGLTTAAVKASAGATEHLPVARVSNLTATLQELKKQGLWVYGADMEGQTYEQVDMTGPAVFVLGSEGFGISRLVREACDFMVSIPLYGQVNSLNVSAAAAVLFCEAARQRRRI